MRKGRISWASCHALAAGAGGPRAQPEGARVASGAVTVTSSRAGGPKGHWQRGAASCAAPPDSEDYYANGPGPTSS